MNTASHTFPTLYLLKGQDVFYYGSKLDCKSLIVLFSGACVHIPLHLKVNLTTPYDVPKNQHKILFTKSHKLIYMSHYTYKSEKH